VRRPDRERVASSARGPAGWWRVRTATTPPRDGKRETVSGNAGKGGARAGQLSPRPNEAKPSRPPGDDGEREQRVFPKLEASQVRTGVGPAPPRAKAKKKSRNGSSSGLGRRSWRGLQRQEGGAKAPAVIVSEITSDSSTVPRAGDAELEEETGRLAPCMNANGDERWPPMESWSPAMAAKGDFSGPPSATPSCDPRRVPWRR